MLKGLPPLSWGETCSKARQSPGGEAGSRTMGQCRGPGFPADPAVSRPRPHHGEALGRRLNLQEPQGEYVVLLPEQCQQTL